jgi:hypothetical protein
MEFSVSDHLISKAYWRYWKWQTQSRCVVYDSILTGAYYSSMTVYIVDPTGCCHYISRGPRTKTKGLVQSIAMTIWWWGRWWSHADTIQYWYMVENSGFCSDYFSRVKNLLDFKQTRLALPACVTSSTSDTFVTQNGKPSFRALSR